MSTIKKLGLGLPFFSVILTLTVKTMSGRGLSCGITKDDEVITFSQKFY